MRLLPLRNLGRSYMCNLIPACWEILNLWPSSYIEHPYHYVKLILFITLIYRICIFNFLLHTLINYLIRKCYTKSLLFFLFPRVFFEGKAFSLKIRSNYTNARVENVGYICLNLKSFELKLDHLIYTTGQ